MTISFQKYYIQIQSETFCKLIDKLNRIGKTKAAAFWPFLFLRYKNHPLNETWINHERIHFRQQFELLFVFFWFFYYGEIAFLRLFKRLNAKDAYLNSTFEQECYINQAYLNYLNQRQLFAFIKHVKNKYRITFATSGVVTISKL